MVREDKTQSVIIALASLVLLGVARLRQFCRRIMPPLFRQRCGSSSLFAFAWLFLSVPMLPRPSFAAPRKTREGD